MNERLPNSMLDALAREAKPVEHPSADLLAAFIERTLAEAENQSVTDHLARCSDCRDIVFLAGGAAEEAGPEQQAVAAAPSRPRWKWSLVWAAPLAAVLLLAGGYFVWHGTGRIASGPELASKSATEAPVRSPEPSRDVLPTQPAPLVAASSSVAKPRAMAAPTITAPKKNAEPMTADEVAMNAAPPPSRPADSKEPTAASESPKTAEQAPAIAIGVPAGGMAPAPKANAFAGTESRAALQYEHADSLGVAVNRLEASAAQAAHPNWRITPQGKLEHLTSEGWTQAFPEQGRVFRAVAVIGSQVWAGGDGGALFHSSDEGQHWNKASLASGDGAETAAIVTIRFDDPLHGEIGTLSGSSYSTTDGGTTWKKQ